MSRVYYYKDMTPRVRARRSFMLVKGDYNAILRAENMAAIVRKLEATPYRRHVEGVGAGELSVEKVEEALTRAYREEVRFILSQLTNKRAVALFKELLRIIELDSVIRIVQAIILNLGWERASRTIVPFGGLDVSACKSLVEGKNLRRACALVGEETLAGEIERVAQEPREPDRKALEIELLAKNRAAAQLLKRLKELEQPDIICMRLMGIQYDIVNIMTALRMKKLGFKPTDVEPYLASLSYKASREELRRITAAPTLKDAVKVLTSGYYVRVISPILGAFEASEPLPLIETALKRFHAEECDKTFMRIFTLGEGVAYLYLKRYEVQDLIAMIIGRQLNLPQHDITSQLVLHQAPHPLAH